MGSGSRVASRDSFAIDRAGIRRFIRAGDSLPAGWTWWESDEPKPEQPVEPKAKPKKRTVPKAKS